MEPPRTQRYEIEGCIGVGGVGEVFRARDTRLGRAVALKRLLPEPGAPAGQTYAHALREATHLAALQHPHIVSVYDVGEDERGPYLVMELVEGDTLEEAVERGPFPLGDFLLLARQSLDALAAAHRVGLMHRDLKPGNVMLKHGVAGESFEVKLLDFGLSGFTGRRGGGGTTVAASPAEDAGDDSVVGSVHFMAPEQFTRERPPDARTDLYALGCLLYYALTAAYPVEGDTVGTVVERHLKGDIPRLAPRRPEVPDALCAWVMRLLSVRPEERPESAAHALEELQGLRETAFDPARATSVPSLRRLATRRTARLHLPEMAGVVAGGEGGEGNGRWPAFLSPLLVASWRLAAVALGVGALLGGMVGGLVRGSGSRPADNAESAASLTATDRRRQEPPAPAVVVAATDNATLRAHLGAEIVAEGRLLALDSRPNRAVRSLRFEPGADGAALALVFFAGTAASSSAASGPSDASLQAYVGHRVRARGRLSEYRGALQVIVRDPAQIEAVY